MRRSLLLRTRLPIVLSPLAAVTLGLAACTADSTGSGERVAAQGQASIDPENPVFTAASTADLAPLPVWGTFTQTGPYGAPPASGQYTAMTDLDQDPTPIMGGYPVSATGWLGLSSRYATAPSFASDLAAATSAAIGLTQPMTGELQPVWDRSGLNLIFGEPNVTALGQSFYGWTPVAGRYIRAQWGAPPPCSRFCMRGDTLYVYPDPPDLQEQRERGARLFCAAREAQHVQGSNTQVMGEEAAVSFSLLGQNIQLLAVEPMVSIDGPQKFIGTATDGAQAFVVPMKFGTRITPVKGFGLPSLPEVRYPVALVTGDSEVATNALLETVPGPVHAESVYGKQYLTVEHMDGFVVGDAQASSSNTFLLFSIGPVDVDLTLGLTVAAGQSQKQFAARQTQIAPGRLLQNYSDGSVVPRTTIQQTSAFMDGPWIGQDFLGPFVAMPGYVYLPDSVTGYGETTPNAYATRALQNDDHYLAGGTTSLSLNTTLSGVLGLTFGPVDVDLQVSGGITGEVDQLHMVRDAAFAQQPHSTSAMVPATGLVVRPRTEASVTLGPLAAVLNMSVNLGFFSASWQVQLFSTGTIPLASYDSDTTSAWPPATNLRIGTGSVLGADIRDQPTVDTQLPNGSPFQALPQSVTGPSSCLVDPTPNPPNAPLCGSAPATPGAAPSTNLCAYENLNEAACSSVGTLSSMPAPTTYQQCANDLNMYLCGINPHYQPPGSPVYSVMSASTLSAIGTELKACGILAAKAGLSQAAVGSYLQSLVGFSACAQNGAPLSGSQIFQAPTASTPPPVSTGGSCN